MSRYCTLIHTFPSSCFNTLRPRQNGRHFPDDIFKCFFLNENVSIAVKISMKFVPKGPINNIPALVQIMAWRRLNQLWLVYRRIYASLGLNGLTLQLISGDRSQSFRVARNELLNTRNVCHRFTI